MSIILRSSDAREFSVARSALAASEVIMNLLSDVEDITTPLDIPNLDGTVLEKVVTFLVHHAEAEAEIDAEPTKLGKAKLRKPLERWDVAQGVGPCYGVVRKQDERVDGGLVL